MATRGKKTENRAMIEPSMTELRNVLFVCSRNQWRSPTAETIWRRHPTIQVRSAGTSPRARRTVTAADIRWADLIFAMESKHRNRLRAEFSRLLEHKPVHVLGIPDDYKYMDPELVDELKTAITPWLPEACLSFGI